MSTDEDLAADQHARPRTEVVRLWGEYDSSRHRELREHLLADSTATVVIGDMSRVVFLDSTTLSALLRIQEALGREGRRLVLDNVPPPVRKVFELTDLLATFDVL
jgi:anti-anti-sigma factor